MELREHLHKVETVACQARVACPPRAGEHEAHMGPGLVSMPVTWGTKAGGFCPSLAPILVIPISCKCDSRRRKRTSP